MVVTVRSLGLSGISGYEVSVECFLSGGLPAFDVVGLPDAAVRESRERVRAAIKACGARFPVSRITVNLAPAGQRKEGTVYDLPILLGDVFHRIDGDPLGQGGLRGVLGRDKQLADAHPGGAQGHGQNPRHRAQRAGEAQLP